jgi:phosphoserine phosphatase
MKIILLHNELIPQILLREFADKYPLLNSKEYSTRAVELELGQLDQAFSKTHFRQHAALHACDVIFPKPHFKFQQARMIAFDMDSTLINIECIDEIARAMGKMDKVSAITEAAMRGEIKDFTTSLLQRVELLAGTPEKVLSEVYQDRLRLNPGARELINNIKQRNWHTVLVSGGFTYFANRLQKELGIDYAQSNTLDIEHGYLTGKSSGTNRGWQCKSSNCFKSST